MASKSYKPGGEKTRSMRQRVEEFFLGAGGGASGGHGAATSRERRYDKVASGGPTMRPGERMKSKRKK